MNEDVIAIFLADETIPFPVVEPFHNPLCQSADPP